jgi:hypothetical protein
MAEVVIITFKYWNDVEQWRLLSAAEISALFLRKWEVGYKLDGNFSELIHDET